jgi:hypothetical protein
LYSISRFSVLLCSFASLSSAAETLVWEPATVVAVEEVSSPAKTPDPTCRAVPKGATPPARCRPSNLGAERFWRVTVDVGNKRLVVRPYRAPSLFDTLNQAPTVYVDPALKEASSVEVAALSSKSIRLRTDQGQGIPALVDSQELLANPAVPLKATLPPPPGPKAAIPVTPGSRMVLLENSDFFDLEVQESTSQDIGDGAVLYSFTGDSSQVRIGGNKPVFLVLAEGEAAMGENLELSRLQVAKGARQLVYSLTRGRSASGLRITVTQVSATVRRVSINEPLPPGEYVMRLENSNRAYLFGVR